MFSMFVMTISVLMSIIKRQCFTAILSGKKYLRRLYALPQRLNRNEIMRKQAAAAVFMKAGRFCKPVRSRSMREDESDKKSWKNLRISGFSAFACYLLTMQFASRCYRQLRKEARATSADVALRAEGYISSRYFHQS